MEPEERPAKVRKLGHEPELEESKGDRLAQDNGDQNNPDVAHSDEHAPHEGPGNLSANGANGETHENHAVPKISKNQLKKQRRHERWEAGREDRKIKRKEKIKARRERKREEWHQARQDADGDATDGVNIQTSTRDLGRKGTEGAQVPVSVIFDCGFDDFMFEQELKSLALQITRGYSDNRKAPFRTHLALSSFGGKLQERFDGVLAKQYTSWTNFRFFQEDFVEVAQRCKDTMSGKEGGVAAGALVQAEHDNDNEEPGEVVYLSSESDVVLDRLKPHSTYIIGGLVDKNRHKGICYKRAVNRGIKTAKLPIGEFLDMKSRQVLATNHVLEIMLRWLEFGDWGKAFMEVIPKRKGGVLKNVGNPDDGDVEIALETGSVPDALEEASEAGDGKDEETRGSTKQERIDDEIEATAAVSS